MTCISIEDAANVRKSRMLTSMRIACEMHGCTKQEQLEVVELLKTSLLLRMHEREYPYVEEQ